MGPTVVLASGGINSAVTAARAKQSGDVYLLHVDYGQRALAGQSDALRDFAQVLQMPVTTVELPHVAQIAGLKRTGSSPEDASAPAALDSVAHVPGLMTVLLGVGVQLARRLGARSLQVGTSEAAEEIESESAPGQGHPVRRREFFYLFGVMLGQSQKSKTPLELETPLIDLARHEIVKLGTRYHTPFDLTYSCDTGRRPPCGECAGCLARNKAFAAAHLLDPAAAAATA